MLLIDHLRARSGRQGAESGSAMAAVVAVVAITAVVAAGLLTSAVFSVGFTSATRAAVQAQAAAEAGLDYAAANLSTCSGGVIASAAGSQPEFSVTVEHRTFSASSWAPCAPRGAYEVRLVSTGKAASRGTAGQTRGDVRSMTAILRNEFPRAVVGDRGIRVSGTLLVSAPSGPVEMSTNADFVCNGSVSHSGTLFVGGLVNPKQPGYTCGRTGPVVQGSAVNPDVPPNLFPQMRKSDLRRWPTTTQSVQWLASTLGSTGTDPCTIVTSPAMPVVIGPVLVDATSCTGVNGLTLSFNGTLSLAGDVVIMADKLTTEASRTMQVRSQDGKERVLYLIRPWPANRVGGCPADPDPDFLLNGDIRTPDLIAAVMLYSSGEIMTGTNSGKNPLNGQMYACQLTLQGSADVRFRPVGPMLLLSKRDLPAPG